MRREQSRKAAATRLANKRELALKLREDHSVAPIEPMAHKAIAKLRRTRYYLQAGQNERWVACMGGCWDSKKKLWWVWAVDMRTPSLLAAYKILETVKVAKEAEV